MFDAIARRYDRLNLLLSAGIDRRWRRRAIRELGLTGRERVLDMCTGTGDLAIEAVRSPYGRAAMVVGVDFAGEMLRLGLLKVRQLGLARQIVLARGDATSVPLPDASVEAAMVAFGIRNVVDPAKAAREFARVLKPGGQLAVLEFGQPPNPVIRAFYGWYSRVVLPRIGRLISQHSDAYSYLPASVEQFPSPDAFAAMLKQNGFSTVRYVPMTFGVVYLYVARI